MGTCVRRWPTNHLVYTLLYIWTSATTGGTQEVFRFSIKPSRLGRYDNLWKRLSKVEEIASRTWDLLEND